MAVQKLIDRLPGIVDAAGEVRRCHAGPGQVILQLQTNLGRFRQACLQQLPAYRVGKSHGYYSPSVSSRTMSSMKSGLAAVSADPVAVSQLKVGGCCCFSWHFGSILEVSDLAYDPQHEPVCATSQ